MRFVFFFTVYILRIAAFKEEMKQSGDVEIGDETWNHHVADFDILSTRKNHADSSKK